MEEDQVMKSGSPYVNPYLREDMAGIDHSTLPLGKVVAFDEEYNMVATFNIANVVLETSTTTSHVTLTKSSLKLFLVG
jgi:hypothetical protein